MTRVAIPSISFCQTGTPRKAVLEKYPDARFNEKQRRMSDEEMVVFLSDRDAAIMGLENLTAEMLDQLPDLKIISRMSVGLDNVDPALLRARGIRIGWTGGTNRRSCRRTDNRVFDMRATPCRAALRRHVRWRPPAPSGGPRAQRARRGTAWLQQDVRPEGVPSGPIRRQSRRGKC